MLTTGIQTPPEPLARARASYHDGFAGEADVSVPFELSVMGPMALSFARRAGRRGPSVQPVCLVLWSRP
jgi:hypothetical protein